MKNIKEIMNNRDGKSLPYFFKKKKITEKVPRIEDNFSKEFNHKTLPYAPIAEIQNKEIYLTLTQNETDMIDSIARDKNMSFQGAFGIVIHDALSLYKEMSRITERKTSNFNKIYK